MKIKVIVGFPATGKSYYKNLNQNLRISDSDSSQFSWIKKGERNPQFPNNYIQHIKQIMPDFSLIFVSSHELVRKGLVQEKIPFLLVYPKIELKTEYIRRIRERGNTEQFVKIISDNWNNWIHQLQYQKRCFHIELQSNEYISIIEEYYEH